MIDGNWRFRNLEGYNGTSQRDRRRRARAHAPGRRAGAAAQRGQRAAGRRAPRGLAAGACGKSGPCSSRRGSSTSRPTSTTSTRLNRLDVTVRAEPRSETCSLEPVQFPYRLENVQGVFTYGSGRRDLRAVQRVARPREDGLQRHVQFPARRRLAASPRSPFGRSPADGPGVHAGPAAATQEGAGRAERHGSHEPARQHPAGPRRESGGADDFAMEPERGSEPGGRRLRHAAGKHLRQRRRIAGWSDGTSVPDARRAGAGFPDLPGPPVHASARSVLDRRAAGDVRLAGGAARQPASCRGASR